MQAWVWRVLGAPDSGLGGGMGATEAGARVSLRGEGEERLKIGGQEQSWSVCVMFTLIPPCYNSLNSLHFNS